MAPAGDPAQLSHGWVVGWQIVRGVSGGVVSVRVAPHEQVQVLPRPGTPQPPYTPAQRPTVSSASSPTAP